MQTKIDSVSEAIADGLLSMTQAVEFSIALANGSWGVVNDFYKLVESIAQL